MTPLKALHPEQDQAVWLDFISRAAIADGSLKTLVEQDGVRGVTSNPAIFEKAIAGSEDYDPAIRAALEAGDADIGTLYESLAIADIQDAADILRPVFDASGGGDGYVSLEVSPYLANDAKATIAEARRLHAAVNRPNLMVKVPATPAGLVAIRQLISEGISINVTLLFSRQVYEQVANAFVEGLQDLDASGDDVAKVASVASFFISRIDTAVDSLLDQRIGGLASDEESQALVALKGKVAIANAKLAYQSFGEICTAPAWQALAAKGAKPQRLLWASTGTKNKAYSDVLYVDELIGKQTVNTMPPATMDAFRDHGTVAATLDRHMDAAETVMAKLAETGIDIEAVAAELLDQGVQLFAEAADRLLDAVAEKRAAILGDRLNAQTLELPAALQGAVDAALEGWQLGGSTRLLWARDPGLWTNSDENRWLGWLDLIPDESAQGNRYAAFAEEVRTRGFTDVVVLGMGGSSLGPEVLAEIYGPQAGFPKLRILDSTHPDEIRALEAELDLPNTLFIVASKSGSTLEPNLFCDYFFGRMKEVAGGAAASHFVAVTDPGSALEQRASADKFWHIFHGVPEVGGRYSVLSAFGLVPAAAMGIDIAEFLSTARTMFHSCGALVPPVHNPGVGLGVALGVAALTEQRDKVTLIASPRLAPFGAWAEQLIAESTGKQGKALIPVDGEPLGAPDVYGPDRSFVYLRLADAADPAQDAGVAALAEAGHPVIRIDLKDAAQIPQEFFRFEIATAIAGAVLGIDPFNQPDVEASKVETRKLFEAAETTGALPEETPIFEDEQIALFADPENAAALPGAGDGLEPALREHFARIKTGDYVALLAYIPRNPANTAQLRTLCNTLREKRKAACCAEFGPRFLHSTGQAYKGGPDSGVFLQITAEPAQDLSIPDRKLGFATVVAAQARGDLAVLSERGRRALRVHIKHGDVTKALDRLEAATQAALA
ncbi:bifunctional transaldolase/phosoglucose isomerase [Methyloligella sp. 2.7D]|uniref:bifunctional transaldolase/phosoglucose isomerase n=1 Tax=unclassified Methyloligella TaxID=2625955 RepID=UPI00157BD610|nr:bifunctional transaldolase/phosoglucose isomerase [Methyloligella sp. GL2]QKP76934.1 bifunctional transaldolase/phosoglucose isomerase [Methyloligella sp. GL2]